MNKDTARTVVTIIVGFGLAFLIVGTSPAFQACMHEHQNYAGEHSLKDNIGGFLIVFYKSSRACGGEWLHRHGEGVIALFTIILGIATWLLWRATRQLVLDARETSAGQLTANQKLADAAMLSAKAAIESERAYLFVTLARDGVGMGYGADASELPLEVAGQIAGGLSVQINLKNFGKTPAILKEFSHRLRHGSGEWPNFADDHDYEAPLGFETRLPAVLGAGDSLPEQQLSRANPTVTPAEYKSAFMGETAIWFYGHAIYDDVFGREIEYRFRWKCSGIGMLRFDSHREFVRKRDEPQEDDHPAT